MLKNKKVILESVNHCDIKKFQAWRNNPELRKYFREYREISDDMQEAWFSKISQDKNQINFSIKEKGTKKLIGHCGLYYISWTNRTAEFGIYIGDFEYRGKGFGSDALRMLCKYGFEELNLNRIWCEVYSNNKSLDMYRHIGFKDEGVLRQTYYSSGKYWDSYILSMLKNEYAALCENNSNRR